MRGIEGLRISIRVETRHVLCNLRDGTTATSINTVLRNLWLFASHGRCPSVSRPPSLLQLIQRHSLFLLLRRRLQTGRCAIRTRASSPFQSPFPHFPFRLSFR